MLFFFLFPGRILQSPRFTEERRALLPCGTCLPNQHFGGNLHGLSWPRYRFDCLVLCVSMPPSLAGSSHFAAPPPLLQKLCSSFTSPG
ncbi:hypothetical protein CSUI_002314, partial [Cystoisospora suis]